MIWSFIQAFTQSFLVDLYKRLLYNENVFVQIIDIFGTVGLFSLSHLELLLIFTSL